MTISLFSKFDTDNSGVLDVTELQKLFEENGVPVSTKEICQIFGELRVKLTLETMEALSEDKAKLKQFKDSLQTIRERRLPGIPITFDGVMCNFSSKVQRKHNMKEVEEIRASILRK